jgi:hypothetical protein
MEELMPETLVIPQQEEDEIVLSLVENKMITHESVRITVTVNAQRDDATSEEAMRTNIKAALRKFVNAEWRFLGVGRQRGKTRFEDVTVSAVARVPESENKQLLDRTNAVSIQGLELTNPVAAYALPFDKVQEVNRELRVALVEQARNECEEYNKNKSGNKYRVASIEFADTPRQGGGMRASGVYASNIVPSGSGGQAGGVVDEIEGSPDLGVTERFLVSAQVILRAKP